MGILHHRGGVVTAQEAAKLRQDIDGLRRALFKAECDRRELATKVAHQEARLNGLDALIRERFGVAVAA